MNVVKGSGRVQTESRTVQGFTEVDLAGQGSLTITQGADEALTIEAEDNLLPVLTSDVQHGRLVLGTKDNTIIRATKPIRYGPHSAQSACRVRVTSAAVTLPGRSPRTAYQWLRHDADRSLTANTLTVNISGAGDQLSVGTCHVRK